MQTGDKILVTRPAHQSDQLCHLIAKQGWHAVRFPVIDIEEKKLTNLDFQRLDGIANYQYVFFVSANAVNIALNLFNGKIEQLHKISCVAVGKATYAALEKYELKSALVPAEGFNSESILALPVLQNLTGQRCLIIRGEGGREFLADCLKARGARVDYLEVYKRALPVIDCSYVEKCLYNKTLAAILIYSGDALINLVELLAKEEIQKKLLSIPLVVISARVEKIAKKIGFNRILIAEEASDAAMINTLLNGEECG